MTHQTELQRHCEGKKRTNISKIKFWETRLGNTTQRKRKIQKRKIQQRKREKERKIFKRKREKERKKESV